MSGYFKCISQWDSESGPGKATFFGWEVLLYSASKVEAFKSIPWSESSILIEIQAPEYILFSVVGETFSEKWAILIVGSSVSNSLILTQALNDSSVSVLVTVVFLNTEANAEEGSSNLGTDCLKCWSEVDGQSVDDEGTVGKGSDDIMLVLASTSKVLLGVEPIIAIQEKTCYSKKEYQIYRFKHFPKLRKKFQLFTKKLTFCTRWRTAM